MDQGPSAEVLTSGLDNATQGSNYDQTLAADGGVDPYTWSISSGWLPAGLSSILRVARLPTPSSFGTSLFTVTANDSSTPTHQAVDAELTLTVEPEPIAQPHGSMMIRIRQWLKTPPTNISSTPPDFQTRPIPLPREYCPPGSASTPIQASFREPRQRLARLRSRSRPLTVTTRLQSPEISKFSSSRNPPSPALAQRAENRAARSRSMEPTYPKGAPIRWLRSVSCYRHRDPLVVVLPGGAPSRKNHYHDGWRHGTKQVQVHRVATSEAKNLVDLTDSGAVGSRRR